MAASKYDKYMVTISPKGRKGPGVWLMSEELVPGCNVNIMYNWIREQPKPNPMHQAMEAHDYDEIIVNLGTDPQHPEYLGAEIEGYIEDERHLITNTTALFFPRHVAHGRITWKSFEKPHLQMAIKLSGKIEPMGPPPKRDR
jgi:hypothetical protein